MLIRLISMFALATVCVAAYSQQSQSPGLELNLEQFPEQSANEKDSDLQLDLKQFDQQESKNLELNLEQFDEKKDTPKALEESLNVEPKPSTVDSPIGKINTSGSSATKIEGPNTAELDDNMVLLKAGFWLFAIALIIFLLIRARIRKRRRSRPPGTGQYQRNYDEQDHR